MNIKGGRQLSTKITHSLLLALTAAALAGPTAAVAQPVYEPGDVPARSHVQAISTGSAASHYTPQALLAMGARMQAQADYYARSTNSIRHAGEILRQMGDHWAADAALARARAQETQGTTAAESAPVGDRWGSDAYQRAATESTPVGDRWGSDAYQQAQGASNGVTASSSDGGSNLLEYVLVSLGILVAAIAAFFGFSQLRGGGSRPRVAHP
jgi:hypothetical protein